MLRQYLICNERLEIFLTYFCNILCDAGMCGCFFSRKHIFPTEEAKCNKNAISNGKSNDLVMNLTNRYYSLLLFCSNFLLNFWQDA